MRVMIDKMEGKKKCQDERENLESLVIQRRKRRTWIKKHVMVVIIFGTKGWTVTIARGAAKNLFY